MDKIKKRISCILLCAMLLLLFCPQTTFAEELADAEEAPLTFTNLELGTKVEAYQIAGYSQLDKKYTWASSVADWMSDTQEGQNYTDLTVEKFMSMSEDRAMDYCHALLKGLQRDDSTIPALPGFSFVVSEIKEKYEVDTINPGYYLILPKGVSRVYKAKLLKVEPSDNTGQKNTYRIDYSEEQGDYFIPTVEVTVTNVTEDRGQTSDENQYMKVQQDDVLSVNALYHVPKYYETFSAGKRIINLSAVADEGLVINEASISVEYKSGEEEEYKSLQDTAYTRQIFQGASVFYNTKGQMIFFGTGDLSGAGGYFYYPGGIQITGLEEEKNTVAGVLEKYNAEHDTLYELPGDYQYEVATVEVDEDNPEEVLEVNPEEGTGEAIEAFNENANEWELSLKQNATVLVVALGNTDMAQDIRLNFEETKSEVAGSTGIYGNQLMLVYSTSPLDEDLLGTVSDSTAAAAYCLKIYLCMGDGYSNSMSVDEILADKSLRLTGVNFFLYRYEGESFEGDKTDQQQAVVEETIGEGEDATTQVTVPPRLIYDDLSKTTYQYEYVQTLSVNSMGEATVGGIEPGQYLVVQSNYTPGRTLATKAIKIAETDWSDDKFMEGNYCMDILWLNYETRYLPGTGKTGIVPFIVAGTIVAFLALIILFERIFGIKLIYLIAYLLYLMKHTVCRKIKKVKK